MTTVDPVSGPAAGTTAAPANVPHAGQIPWMEPVAFWFISRVLCLVAMTLGSLLLPIERTYKVQNREKTPAAGSKTDLQAYYHEYAADFHNLKKFGKQPMLFVSPGGGDRWARPFVRWDAVWWLSVAEVGYVADPKLAAEQNVVFYPLFPLLIRAVHATGIPLILSAMLLVNGLMLVATCLLYRLVAQRSGLAAARWTIALWLLFPTAFFSAIPYSEALLGLLSILALDALLKQNYVSSGLWCGLASAIKNQGVIIGGALLIPFLAGPKRGRALIGMLCAGLGLLAYMVFLQQQFGDPLLFVSIQKVWRPKLGNPNPVHWLIDLINSTRYSLWLMMSSRSEAFQFYSGRILDPWLGWWVILWLPAVRKLHWGLVLSSVVMVLLPLSTGTIASLGRYVWVIVPVFVVMGERAARSGWRWPVVLLSTAGLLWQAFLFGGGWEVI